MSLSRYKEKRSFSVTPEPEGGKSEPGTLHFTIQKHAASRLHYDFRLEMEGVLKSWAVPKGPSTDTSVKRLAMMVEDHPYDYRNFEGIIPKGQYGGGTVIVWDEGTYEAEGLQGKSKKEQEKHLLSGLEAGNLKFVLKGEKLRGGFALVKIHGRGENTWLLIKHHDEFAAEADITLEEKSVVSGLTLDQVAAGSGSAVKRPRKAAPEPKPVKKNKATGRDKPHKIAGNVSSKELTGPEVNAQDSVPAGLTSRALRTLLEEAPLANQPEGLKPMLATLVDEPFDSDAWSFEVKWDGYRALAYLGKEKNTELLSRNAKSFNEKYYSIYELLTALKLDAVFDGEIVVLNSAGISDFGALQNWRSEADGELVYYVFDLLWYNGHDLRGLAIEKRQAILAAVLPVDDDRLRISNVFRDSGTDFFKAASEMGLEGIIAKKLDSTYSSGLRSTEWLKVKVHKRQEVIIAGYTRNEDTPKLFSSLLLAVYSDKKLQYAGKVGTGFSVSDQQYMMSLFKPLVIKDSPFDAVPDVNKPSRFRPNPPSAVAVWLKPELVCEVAFAEITSDGVFRHPSFQGMRTDKKANEVVREVELPVTAIVDDQPADAGEDTSGQQKHQVAGSKKIPAAKKNADSPSLVKPSGNRQKKTLVNPAEETQVRKICGHELKFTHLSKVYWPAEGYTKRDLLNYYYQVAEYILPYLKDRPQSLNRFPSGISGPSFYQKDVTENAPEWARTFPHTTSEGEHKLYLVGADEATLLWMASLGCIEMNPWFSRISNPDNPDFCVIDLDPDKNTFDQVIEAALVVKDVLGELGVNGYPKTSGSTGMHIYIPLGAAYSYEQSQLFARLVVNAVHARLPAFTSLERMIKNRNGRMYLDFLQNRPGATIAGPYSLRPKPGATVSMPLHWDEVKPGLQLKDFTILNSVGRLKETGDLFSGVLGAGIQLDEIIRKLEG